MRIAINALSARLGAAVTFYRNFLPALGSVDSQHDYVILLHEHQIALFPSIPKKFEVRIVPGASKNFLARSIWEQAVLPFLLRKWKIDILYSQGNFTSFFAPCRKVVVITGSNPYSEAKLEPFPSRMKHGAIGLASYLSTRTASRVVFLSQDSREKIGRKLRLPENKTAVVYYGCQPLEGGTDSGRFHFEDYVLTVSVVYRHKNLERLMRAFDRLVRTSGYRGKLVIAGTIYYPNYYRSLLTIRDSLESREQIVFTEDIAATDVAYLYRHARLFVIASVEETFGLPLVEAMNAGLPIAASDTRLAEGGEKYFNPFRELAGDAADYFNPFDEESICAAMQRLLSDDDHRRELASRALKRAGKFSWAETARGTADLFDAIAAESYQR
jgi:glycosyltransferase involved in cell wall biosynthesis